MLALVLVTGSRDAAADDFPGTQLRARLEIHLDARKSELKENLSHYGSIFEVEQQALDEFIAPVWCHWDGTGFTLGTGEGSEPHGGGVLAFLLDHWRPDDRPARLDDEYWFRTSRIGVPLREIYRSHQRQIFLPVPGRSAAEIHGELPASPQLPRMRSSYWTDPAASERDAYAFLGLLVAREEDPGSTWRNHLDQELSVDLLLRNTRDYYLAKRTTDRELADHSHLHLVEVLLAWDRRNGGHDANQIKRRFLEVELTRDELSGDDGNGILAHYVESLGLLVAEPGVSWTPAEKQHVMAWLRRLERDRFGDLGPVRLQDATHVLKGLRLIGAQRHRLEDGSSGSVR